MSDGLLYELTLVSESFIMGVWLMMVYDLLRVIRLFIPHHPLWTGIEDFVFWIYAAIMTFSLLYKLNEGTLRGYAILMTLAGMVLFDRICSRFWLKLLKTIRKYIKMKLKSLRRYKKYKG